MKQLVSPLTPPHYLHHAELGLGLRLGLEFMQSAVNIVVLWYVRNRDVKFIFSKFEFRPLKFGLNLNFVYIFVKKLKQFVFDVCTVGRNEGHSTHATRREAVYQQRNQPGRQAKSSQAVD